MMFDSIAATYAEKAPVRHQWLAHTAGDLLDVLTVAGMAAGLKERLTEQDAGLSRPGPPAPGS